MSFNLSLGHPGASFSPSSPTTSSAKPRHRGTAEKERGRQRAARHQALKVTAPVPTPVPSQAPASAPALVTHPVPSMAPELVPSEVPAPVTVPVTVPASMNAPVSLFKFNTPSFSSIASRCIQAPSSTTHKYMPGTKFSDCCPGNAPPLPPCEKCGKATTWNCSWVASDLSWLHVYLCSCSKLTSIITPPIS